MLINELYGAAYEQAIDNVINTVARCGWGWNHTDNREDAHEIAMILQLQFDENGNNA